MERRLDAVKSLESPAGECVDFGLVDCRAHSVWPVSLHGRGQKQGQSTGCCGHIGQGLYVGEKGNPSDRRH